MDTRVSLLVFLYLCKSLSCYTFIGEPKSYLKFRQWNATSNGSLTFRFKTYKKYGLLMYTDNSRSSSSIRNAVLIMLRRARFYIRIQIGDEDYKSKKELEVGENLDDMQWHTVKLVRNGKETGVILDGSKPKYLQNDGVGETLTLNSGLYVGGVPDEITEEKNGKVVFKNVKWARRFIGCIESLRFLHSHEVGSESKTDTLAIVRTPQELKGVKSGCLDACSNVTENKTCRNGGRCRNKFVKFDCDCKLTGFQGSLCHNVSDSIQFDGKSYVTLDIPKKSENIATTDLSFRFRTKQGNGVIFAAQSHLDHIMFELYNTVIRFSIDLGGGHHTSVIQNKPFNDGEWHTVQVMRTGINTRIVVDKRYCLNTTTRGVHTQLDFRKSPLYVGGHPNLKVLEMIKSKSKSNFTGCLQQAYFNDKADIVYKVNQYRSTLIKKYGKIMKGCNVRPPRVILTRVIPPPDETKSGGEYPEEYPNAIGSTLVPGRSIKEEGEQLDDSSLSRQSYVWITVGLVIGSIILVITVGVIVHNVRYRYRAVLLSSSLKSLRDSNSLHRRFSSNDRMLRGSTDRMLHHGSSDRFMRASTDRLLRGTSTERMTRTSTERMLRGSTERIMRASTDRLPRGSVDRLIRTNSERRLRGSNDRMLRISTDNERPLRTCGGDNRSMRSSISRLERSTRGSSVHGSIHTINERMVVRDNQGNNPNNNINNNNNINSIPISSNNNYSHNNTKNNTPTHCQNTTPEEAMDARLSENEPVANGKDHSLSTPPPPYKL